MIKLSLTLAVAVVGMATVAEAGSPRGFRPPVGGHSGGIGPVIRDHRIPPVIRDHRIPTPPVVRDHRTPPVVRDHRIPTPPVIRDHRIPPVVRDHRTPWRG
jgi:hypothetical protein